MNKQKRKTYILGERREQTEMTKAKAYINYVTTTHRNALRIQHLCCSKILKLVKRGELFR